MTAPRGLVLGLTPDQVAARAKALGDPSFVAGYYLLKDHNGGKDPTAPDPFERWQFQAHDGAWHDGAWHEARTADCIAGAMWCVGADRYQPVRFQFPGNRDLEGYAGEINTDSMILDALGPAKCFVRLAAPAPGCFLVAKTGAPGFEECGHIATLHTVPDVRWDSDDLDLWRHLLGTDVAMRSPARANQPCVASWWYRARHAGAIFARSIMTP